ISYPTHIGSGIAENDGVGLKFPDVVPDAWPVIILLAIHLPIVIGSTIVTRPTIGSVKPHLKDFTVLGQHFFQLVVQIIQILFCPIISVVAVPGRIIDTHFQAISVARLPQFLQYITLAIFPGAVFHRMFGVLGWPKNKTVVMLCRDDNTGHTRFFGQPGPLHAIEVGWIE